MNLEPVTPPPGSLPAPRHRKWWFFPGPVVWFVLLISLAGAAGGWFIAHEHALLEARKRFDEEAGRVTAALTERMQIYEDVLHGAAGLYAASYTVERGEWRSYLESVSIERRFPGIDGVGFLAFVPPGSVEEFLRITRADKSADFAIREPLTTNDLMVVKYIEPEERHRGMLGRNMALDPEWLAVAERARNTGLASLSGKVTLRDAARRLQPGCVMLLPVYRREAPRNTVAARQASIEGWVFARFITQQLMQGVLGKDHPRLHFRIEDTDAIGSDRLIFDNAPALSARRPEGRQLFSSVIPARFGGRSWTLRFYTKPAFEAASRLGSSLWVGAAGGLISVLLFSIAWSLSHTRERALALAATMTQTLRTTNDHLQSEIRERERVQRRTATQYAVTRVLADSATLPEATAGIVQAICQSLDWDVGALWQIHSLTNRLHCVEFWSRPGIDVAEFEAETRRRTFASGEGFPGRVWSAARALWVPDVLKEKNFPRVPAAEKSGLHGAFGFPIVLGNELLGVIEFFSREITKPDQDLLNMMAATGSQIGQFIERKRAEEAMRQAKEAAEEANRTKSQFLASMSHELRTPLNSVIGFANIMLKNKAGNLGSADLNFLDRIQANGKHLLGLINEVLDLSKIEARKVELQTNSVDLDLLVRETVAQQEGLVRDKPVRLVADLPPRVAPLVTDADKLRQVIINLIGNALKFTEHGTVTVRVVTDPGNDRPTCLQVIDTGIGIPREKLGVIFEAFQQAEAGTTRKYGGTGLGLTISQALCQLMGYHIEVASDVGHGSTFSVCLAPEVTTLPRPPAPTAPLFNPRRNRILVIDDEEDSRKLLASCLEDSKCDVRTVASAPEASQVMDLFPPDLILLDLVMPGTDGLKFLAQLRSSPRFQRLPVAIVTARELTTEEAQQLRYLAQDIVRKGTTLDTDLHRVLHRFLRDGLEPIKEPKA